MIKKFAFVFVAAVALAACATNVPDQPDFASGMWDGQTIVPPPGLLTSQQGRFIGRTVDNEAGSSPLVINDVLVDPTSAVPRYAVVSNKNYSSLHIIPMAALHVSPGVITVAITDYSLENLPRYDSLAALESRYPHTVVTTPVVVQPATPAVGMLPPVVPLPPPAGAPAPGALSLAHSGSVVGYPVVDSAGQPVGQVAAVAVVPTTGEVRYAIVSGPSFGAGDYIAIPANDTRVASGQVVLNEPLSSWTQAPRYRGDQLPQALGVVGSLD